MRFSKKPKKVSAQNRFKAAENAQSGWGDNTNDAWGAENTQSGWGESSGLNDNSGWGDNNNNTWKAENTQTGWGGNNNAWGAENTKTGWNGDSGWCDNNNNALEAENTHFCYNGNPVWGQDGLVIQPTSSESHGEDIRQTEIASQNPTEEDFGPPAYPCGESPGELKHKKLLEELQDWPWNGVPERLVTLGPYLPNYYHREPFSLPEADQISGLFTLLAVDIIRHTILGWVLRDHFDAANFARSCRSAFRYAGYEISFWDMSDGWFNQCENPRSGPESSDKPNLQGSVQSVLVVTPVRHPKGAKSKGGPGEQRFYAKQMAHLRTMCQAMFNFADFLDNVQLHRVPFLTADILNLVIPNLRNLRVLGIYKCQLIHIGDTIRLLDLIKTDRPLGKEDQVYLDFFPNYHLGPKTCSTGSYGVLWDNWNGDTRLAIWQLVSRILPRAFSQGIDMTKPGTAFRTWLEMSPCWNVEETIKVIMTPDADPVLRVAYIDYPRYKGDVDYFLGRIWNRPEGWKWATKTYMCCGCEQEVLGIFYSYTQIKEGRDICNLGSPNSTVTCLGCTLEYSLDNETDHLKYRKRDVISLWLQDDDGEGCIVFNTTDLPRALEEYGTKNIALYVHKLDRARYRRLKTSPYYDVETNERQRELTLAELGRRGRPSAAPQVGGWGRWQEQFTLTADERQWWDFAG